MMKKESKNNDNEKVVLVTGGAQGIGKAIAKAFVTKGANVFIIDKDKAAGIETQKEYQTLGNIKFIHIDIAKETQIKNLIKKFKRLDILVNNAGLFKHKNIESLTLKEWQEVLDINLTGAFLLAKYAAPLLKKENGSIINITSTRAMMSEPNTEAYAATKGGLLALTHALAISLGPNVRVNCISPGWIETSDWKKSKNKRQAKHSKKDKDQHPVGRVGVPDDVASMAVYLSSHKATFITGANFIVDGGMSKKMIYV